MKTKIREAAVTVGRSQLVKEYLGITLGILITAVGLDIFLIPNRLAAGGVSGLATVLHYGLGLPVGVMMLVLNAVLLTIGTRVYGARYGMKTIYGALGLSLMVDLLATVFNFTRVPGIADPILGTLYGGILTGIGMGIVFRNGGNTGGTDIIAQILVKYTDLGVGQLFLLVDGFVMLVAASVFGIKLALFGFIAVFIMGWVIDTIQEGIGVNKAAFIITEKSGEIAGAILNELKRGATGLSGRGLFTGEERETILCVVSRREIEFLRRVVHREDPRAFMLVTDVREVVGEGFGEFKL
ncbi:MAG: YitT family protein [Actinobacteria bacterium]|nr:YitT family protein [Actinomycetota bacterium]